MTISSVATATPTASALLDREGLPVPPPVLSAPEVAAFQRDGFLVRDGVLPAAAIADLREALATCGLQADIDAAREQVIRVELIHRDPRFLALARDPRLVGAVAQLIGPDLALEHSKLSAQPHGPGGGVSWHQDLAFYPHTNPDVLAVMVMLDDATPENGCMRMIPGSHRLGVCDHDDDAGMFTGSCRDQARWADHPGAVAITPRAGGISIHHGLTLHASGGNRSGRPRRGLVLNYRAADAYQLADMAFIDTGMMVSGRYRGTARCEAMTLRLPRFPETWSRGRHGSAWNQVGTFAAGQNTALGLDASGA